MGRALALLLPPFSLRWPRSAAMPGLRMATYGNFETIGRIYSIGARAVYSAKRSGAGKDEYVVKVINPEDVFGEDPESLVREFSFRASIQQKLSESGAKAWTRVHEIGKRDAEVYYVTDRAASNAQQLVAGKVRTEGADLYRVVSRVIEGLRELRASADRAHANLKPSNILIDRTGDVATAGVTLTDPSGVEQKNRAAAEHADVRDLGDLIHQLVLHVPFRAMGGYPIEDSPGWARLGKAGQQWRALVNRMLDPAASPGSITIESVAGEIEALKARPSAGPKPALLVGLALGAVALLAGGAFVVWPMISGSDDGGDEVRFDQQQWTQWCARAPWAISMQEALRNPARRADLERDPYLASTLLPLADRAVELRPYRALPTMDLRPTELTRITASPPPEVRTTGGAAATTAAVEWIQGLEGALAPESWPALRTLGEADARLSALGWDRFAQDAREMVSRVSRRDDAGAGQLLLAVIDVARNAPDYERLLAAIAERNPDPESRETPTQARIINNNPDILSGVERVHIDALIAYLNDPRSVIRAPVVVASNPGGQGDPIATIPGVDPPGGTQAGTPQGQTNPNGQTPGTDLTPQVADIGPDPRTTWEVPAQVDALRARLAEGWVRDLEGAAIQGAAQAQGDLEVVAGVVASVGDLEWAPESRDAVREGMNRASSRVALLGSAIENLHREYVAQVARAQDAAAAAAQAARDHEAFVAEFRARRPASLTSAYLIGQWGSQRDAAIDRYADPAQLGELRNAATQLERAVGMAESGIPNPIAPEGGPEGYDRQALGAYLAALRERAIEAVWNVGAEDAFGARYDAAIIALRGEIDAAAEGVRRLVGELTLAQAGMMVAASWDEPLARAEGAPTLSSLAARLSTEPPPPELRAALGPIPERLAALSDLVTNLAGVASISAPDRELLEESVADPRVPFVSRLYTWRALRAVPGVTLAVEQEMLTALRAGLSSVPQGRRAALSTEFDDGALARWNAAIEDAQTRAEYQNALDARSMVERGVNFTALSPRTQFNLSLVFSVQRLEALPSTATDDQVREVLQNIVDAANRQSALVNTDEQTRRWIQSVTAALNQTGGMDVNVLATRGPGAAGWSFQALDPQANRVRYARSAGGENLAIEFVRLDPGTDGVAQGAYVATTEVSLRFFGAAANGAGAWGAIATAWGDRLTNVDDSWDGPRVWSFNPSSPNRLAVNNRWLAVQGTGSFNIPRPFAAPEEARSLDMPVQHITAPAARTLAQAVGCRLPTSAEWQAARRREAGSGWNLRDTSWTTQRDFASQRQSRPPLWPFPDAGAFVPIGRDVPIEGDATSAPGASDGVLYFQPVDTGAGSVFRHLVGNVAEFVDDSPPGFTGGEHERGYRVVGGSALSPPELGTDQPLPIVMDPRDNYMVPTNTYADVGFRLAFDSGPLGAGPPLAQQAGELARGLALVRP